MTNKPKLAELLLSEMSDFCAGFGQIGEPSTPEELQSSLMDRVLPIIREADIQLESFQHQLDYRNEVLTRAIVAREAAEAELAAIRGAAVPVGCISEAYLVNLAGGFQARVYPCGKKGYIELFTHPVPPVEVLPEQDLTCPECKGKFTNDEISWADGDCPNCDTEIPQPVKYADGEG